LSFDVVICAHLLLFVFLHLLLYVQQLNNKKKRSRKKF
jgi:hypothetical protein